MEGHLKDTSENYLLSESNPIASKQLFHVAWAPGVERLGHHWELLNPGDEGLEQQTARQCAVLVAGRLWWCPMLQAVQSLEDGEWQRERAKPV